MIRLRITIVEQKPDDVPRQAWRAACKKGFEHICTLWLRMFFPKHFELSARSKYRHKLRSTAWIKKKKNIAERRGYPFGGSRDNVFSGKMMRDLLGSPAVVRGFPTRGRITLTGPDHMRINFRASSNQPNKKAELTAITREEMKFLLREF